jgi:hypothetical protein
MITDEELKKLAIHSAVIGMQEICKELIDLRAEVKTARERLGPAGYKLLQELNELRAQVKRCSDVEAENERLKRHFDVCKSGQIISCQIENERLMEALRRCRQMAQTALASCADRKEGE